MTIDLDHIIVKTAGASKKVAVKAAEAATYIVDGTKNQIERATCRDKIKENYRRIGELTYESANDNAGEIKKLCIEIDGLHEKLNEKIIAV
jgi:hypothetical protein